MVHIYNGILLSHKKSEIMPSAATGVNLNVIILSEDSQIKGNTTRYLLHVGYKRKIQMHLFTKTETSYKNKNLFTKTQT